MNLEMKALKQILAIKGLELPEDVESENPVSEFISEQFAETFSMDNEMLTILRDIFVDRTNDDPLKTLQTLQLFNHAIVNFSMKPETRAYIKELNADPDE
jgi:hypothetical protein